MDKKDLPIIENATWIPLTKGEWALVDTEVALIAPKFHLHESKTSNTLYGRRDIRREGRRAKQYLHYFVFEYYKLSVLNEIDHINGNGLDNRRENLRPSTSSQNKGNSGPRSTNRSGYKGVSWFKRDGNWHAQILIDGKNKHLGYFEDLVLAAKAYDRAAIAYWGIEFAYTNFPKEDYFIQDSTKALSL